MGLPASLEIWRASPQGRTESSAAVLSPLHPHQPSCAKPAESSLRASHGPAPAHHSCPWIPGDVVLASPSLCAVLLLHQLLQAAVPLQRLRYFPRTVGSDGVLLQAAKVRKASVNIGCPIGGTSVCWVAGRGGQQVLVTHCRVISLWLVNRASARKVAPSSLMVLCCRLQGERSKAVHGSHCSGVRGHAGVQGGGCLPWRLLAPIPGVRRAAGP